eukprot:12978700-Alexandrium_andersonii.AAC.1
MWALHVGTRLPSRAEPPQPWETLAMATADSNWHFLLSATILAFTTSGAARPRNARDDKDATVHLRTP